jgi:late competence protein required for DNA uptake (superfamily II DNA/RNA helicase)
MAEMQVDWEALNELKGVDLKLATFKIIQQTSHALQAENVDEPRILEVVPRLADMVYRNPDELGKFGELISSLARSTGLWNYINTECANFDDALVAEAVTAPELGGIIFHREQVHALNALLTGKNLILSAPTSFGKSLLIDALLATDNYKRIAVVLPTIALLDEFRRRFRDRFAKKFNVVMHQSEISTDEPTIFLGTQERLIYRDDLGQLDLTVVDEFYKLDPARRDDRSVTLNAAVYKLLKRSKQFFFLGPNIDKISISSDARWNFEFLKTRFSTVAVDTLDLQHVENKRERLIEEIGEDSNWPTLVFVSSPDKANKLAIELSEKMAVSEDMSGFADWLRSNIGANNFLSEAVEYGFGVHHGRIPRAIAARMVRLFDQQKLPVLLCTSTLIEGVNTAAKTVMIFDKKIANESYDFFTFSNIRGRAGRLGQHHIGQVLIFNDVPEQTELEVSPTMFGNDSELPDEFIVHIEKPDRSKRSDSRFQYFKDQLRIEGEELRLASSIGLETATNLRSEVEKSLESNANLIWSGWPNWNEILELCQVISKHKAINGFGAFSPKQLTLLINKLRQASTLKGFLLEQDRNYQGPPQGRDNIFKFLRACEYGLPQHFSVIELFAKQMDYKVDYSLFIGGISSWFRDEILKELDEEGIPIQVSERFYNDGDTKASLKVKLRYFCEQQSTSLTEFEKDWILEAL